MILLLLTACAGPVAQLARDEAAQVVETRPANVDSAVAALRARSDAVTERLEQLETLPPRTVERIETLVPVEAPETAREALSVASRASGRVAAALATAEALRAKVEGLQERAEDGAQKVRDALALGADLAGRLDDVTADTKRQVSAVHDALWLARPIAALGGGLGMMALGAVIGVGLGWVLRREKEAHFR